MQRANRVGPSPTPIPSAAATPPGQPARSMQDQASTQNQVPDNSQQEITRVQLPPHLAQQQMQLQVQKDRVERQRALMQQMEQEQLQQMRQSGDYMNGFEGR